VLLITVVIVNQLLTFNALSGMSTCVARDNRTGWDDCEGGFITKSDGLAALFRTVSFLFFTLTAIVPPLKAGLNLYRRTDQLEKVILDFRLLENEHVKMGSNNDRDAVNKVHPVEISLSERVKQQPDEPKPRRRTSTNSGEIA
jgi:hypothetical protein